MCQICVQNKVRPEYQAVLHAEYTTSGEVMPAPFWTGKTGIASREGAERAQVLNAIAKGNRDENKLTNLVFFNRHKELGGRKLMPGQRGYDSLSREWLYIRNNIVRPVLHKKAKESDSSPELKNFMTGINDVLPAIEKYKNKIPIEFILGWIKIESGGNIKVTPKYNPGQKDLNERGYFQISKEESAKHRFDHERLSWDKSYSIQCGIILINQYANSVRAFGIDESNPIFWKLVKLWHAASGIATYAVRFAIKNGYRLQNWDDFKKYILEREWKNFEPTLKYFTSITDKRAYIIRLFNNVDHLFKWAVLIKNNMQQPGMKRNLNIHQDPVAARKNSNAAPNVVMQIIKRV